ncbi:MAG: hypothetical protein FJ098_00905 [Deltaproteobacteria bacterium]|nr:hypothetical protein [Deltaproteobacteria bacterium]
MGRAALLPILLLCACGRDPGKGSPAVQDATGDRGGGRDAELLDDTGMPDAPPAADLGPGEDALPGEDTGRSEDSHHGEDTAPEEVRGPGNCGFPYGFSPWDPPTTPPDSLPGKPTPPGGDDGIDPVAHPEPLPPGFEVRRGGTRGEIVLPLYEDDMPVFGRALPWHGETRCFELPGGPAWLSEAEAWSLYRRIAERTTDLPLDVTPGVRAVLGIRGASPGTFAWNGNPPNRFNDTLVLLWVDGDGTPRVREHAAHTDTGPVDFGWHASSSLRPNRRYHYANGWHNDYSALRIQEEGYRVRDDTNKNGHWDSDRNGWLPPAGEDHDRGGSLHNIHCASVDGPLDDAAVYNTSAGCQVIPGIDNWVLFIEDAWTAPGDPVSYFLVDARDIDPRVWGDCTADGTHACPFRIETLPFRAVGDTSMAGEALFDAYSCSDADERGPELVWVLNLDVSGMLHVVVDDVPGDGKDVDVHLLEGDDPLACLARDDAALAWDITPGRYLVVVDTWYGQGKAHPGPFTLDVWLD